MLIGTALTIAAIFLCRKLLFCLSVHALPLSAACVAGSLAYRGGSGITAALGVAAVAAIALLATAQIVLAHARSDWARLAVGIAFAMPAGLAGYLAIHGIAVATIPQTVWQSVLALIGSAIIAAASWTYWSRAEH